MVHVRHPHGIYIVETANFDSMPSEGLSTHVMTDSLPAASLALVVDRNNPDLGTDCEPRTFNVMVLGGA